MDRGRCRGAGTGRATARGDDHNQGGGDGQGVRRRGQGDGATPNDLVAVLTKAVRVARKKIGRIELREAYSLVELPAQEAEQIASALNGVTIRRKRVVARIDRGRARPVAGAPGRGR